MKILSENTTGHRCRCKVKRRGFRWSVVCNISHCLTGTYLEPLLTCCLVNIKF